MTDLPAAQSPSDAPLTLLTLGGASLRRAGEPVLGPGKPLALLIYLTLAPGRTATREFLLDLIWADLEHERARHALRQTTWHLRRLLGEDCLVGRDEISLGIPIDADRDRFLRAVEANDPESAIGLYRDPFLPDFALPGTTSFEHWADAERHRLRGVFLRSAETVARRRLSAGRFREAQELARRMRDTSPSSEAAWRVLLEALVAGRDDLQASVEADALLGMLAAEGRAAEPATRAIVAATRRGTSGSAEPDPSSPPGLVAELVGREKEFATLLGAWTNARSGARHVHVSAPAGLGKSRLLADLASRLRSVGGRVASIRANPGDRAVPFAAAGDLAAALGPHSGLVGVSPAVADVLVGLSPALSTVLPNARPNAGGAEAVRLRTAALADAVIALAEAHPLALLIDDVHWLDADSHQVIDGLLHRLERAAVLVVTAGRPGVGRPLSASPGSLEIPLEPLDPAAIEAVIRSLGEATPETAATIARLLYASTGGSPLLVLESLQLALERDELALTSGRWDIPDPARLAQEFESGNALRTRLTGLPPDTEWMLLFASVMGTPLSAADFGAVARARDDVDQHIWTLERRGFLARRGATWEPAHDEIAAAAIDHASPDRRRAAHAAAGRRLLEGAPDSTAILRAIRHFDAANDEPGLSRAFGRYVRERRAQGPRIGLTELARQATTDPARARTLIRQLPLDVRLGLDSTARRVAALAAAGLLLTGAMSLLREGPDVMPELLVVSRDAADSTLFETRRLHLDRNRWRADRPLQPGRRIERFRNQPFSTNWGGFSAASDGETWVFNGPVDDSLTEEVFVRRRTGTTVVYSAARDDGQPAIDPSGQRFVFATARWSNPSRDEYDLAIGSLDGNEPLRRLTSTTDTDGHPAWAPHGTMIAFVRRPQGLAPRVACWISPNHPTPVEHCVPAPSGEVLSVAGWLDDHRVLLVARDSAGDAFLRWDVVTDRIDALDHRGAIGLTTVSPDGRWVVCYCAGGSRGQPSLIVFPTDDPAAARALPTDARFHSLGWRQPAAPPTLSLAFAPDSVSVPLGAAYLADAPFSWRAGERLALPARAVAWSSLAPAIASVDSTGRVTARQPGSVRIVATLPPAADTLLVVVTADTAETILTETWERLDSTRWESFGEPRPRLVRTADGQNGLNNGGDGRFVSGVVSAATFDAAGGLGVEARLSLGITETQWQLQVIRLASDRSHAMASWDRGARLPPRVHQSASEECVVGYPNGEGLAALSALSVHGAGAGASIPVDTSWRHGRWHTVRLQILADGRCGVALDGVPAWISPDPVPTNTPFRLWLQGNSAGTDRVVVGPTRVWRGVSEDIDWEDRARP